VVVCGLIRVEQVYTEECGT